MAVAPHSGVEAQLQDLDVAGDECEEGIQVAPPHEPENLPGGKHAGRKGDVDHPPLGQDRQPFGLLDQGHPLGGAILLGQQGGHHVDLVRRSHADEGVRVLDAFGAQGRGIGAVRMENQGAVQFLGEPVAAFLRDFQDPQIDRGVFQPPGQGIADVPAAVDEHLAVGSAGKLQKIDQVLEPVSPAEKIDRIPGFDHGVRSRDERLARTLNNGDQGLRNLRRLAEFLDRGPGERIPRGNGDAGQDHLVPQEWVVIGEAWIGHQVGQMLRRHLVGVDDQLDSQMPLFREGRVVADVDGLDPGDLLGVADLPGQQAGDDVGFVVVRDRQEQVRVRRARLFQHGNIGGVPQQGGDVEFGPELIEHRGVGIDGDDLHVLAVKGPDDMIADLPCPDDDHFHGKSPTGLRRGAGDPHGGGGGGLSQVLILSPTTMFFPTAMEAGCWRATRLTTLRGAAFGSYSGLHQTSS